MSNARVRLLDSLETRLPILIGSLAAVLLLVSLGLTYYELRSGAIEASQERLERLSEQLAGIAAETSGTRGRQLMQDAGDPRVLGLLQLAGAAGEERIPDSLAAPALDWLAGRTEGALTVLVLDRRGRLVASRGAAAPPAPHRLALADSAPSFGPIFVEGGAALFWMGAPVRQDGRLLGHVLQQRRIIGNPNSSGQIEGLIGNGTEIFFANRAGGPWVGLDGAVEWEDRPAVALRQPLELTSATGEERFAYAVDVLGDWVVIATVPTHRVLARTRDVMRRIGLLGLLLLLGGGVTAWLVSRSVTTPLQKLSAAADAVAAGDYGRRTGVERSDEIGRLAGSFDAMASQVGRTHEQLEQRFREARELAAELEQANERLQQALREVEAARAEAQQANRAKSEFLATISHEVRTPINAIVGYTELMEMGLGGDLSEQHSAYVERIRRSGAHLTALVNDVLDFAKIESGQMRVAREVRSAPAAIHEAVGMLQARLDAKRIRLSVACPVTTVFLGDAQRVHQVLINLLSNAVKYTAEGGSITVTCERRTSHPGGRGPHEAACEWTCITVADTGIGIPTAQLEQIFEPFVQGTAGYTRPHGGTGLGLAISRSLARMMSGDISVESEPGHGSSFTLWLPHPAATTLAST